MTPLQITANGLPKPQGSKTGYPIRRKNGTIGIALTESAGKPLTQWRQTVHTAATRAANQHNWQTPTGPIHVQITFRLPRPKNHYGTGRNQNKLKPTAPEHPTTRPDLDKLARAINDALTSSKTIHDDAQIVQQTTRKEYTQHPTQTPGAQITITPIPHNQ